MRHLLSLVLVCALSLLWVHPGCAQSIGLYFDSAGQNPSFGDSLMEFPVDTQAYIVMKEIVPASGVSGWEAALSWTSGLYVSTEEVYGQSINLGAFPEFKVGMAAPIGVGEDYVVLAILNVSALNPGDLYIRPSRIPSIPGSLLPAGIVNGSLCPLNLV